MKHPLIICALIVITSASLHGQQRLIAVGREQTVTITQQIDSTMAEFGTALKNSNSGTAFDMLRAFGRKVHCTALHYRTTDPLGREVIASGLIAYPERGRFKGTVEIIPYNKEKSLAGSVRLYSPEIFASFFGHVTLLPDNIGYGTTDSLVVAYQMTENSAVLAADFREAVREYLAGILGRALPRETILFGYSLGAPGTLALASHYALHPECHVDVKTIMLGSGSYAPSKVFENTLQSGTMDYMVYPAFVRSLNAWTNAALEPSELFCGRLLEDYELASGNILNATWLAGEYGTDARLWLHPDFFSGKPNGNMLRLHEALESLRIPKNGYFPLPASAKIVIRHSAEDNIVPVECSDKLYKELKEMGYKPRYRRDKHGDHHNMGARCFIDLGLMIILANLTD